MLKEPPAISGKRNYRRFFFGERRLLLWIHHLLFRDVIKHFIQIAVGPPLAHGQAGIQIVAAVLRFCTGDLSFEIAHEFEGLGQYADNILRLIVTVQQQVAAGTAAHGSEVDDLRSEYRMTPKKGRRQMFHGMKFCSVHDRFVIGAGDADVKRGNDRAAYRVLAGYIDARNQFDVVYGEACDFFHFFHGLIPFRETLWAVSSSYLIVLTAVGNVKEIPLAYS